MIWKLVDVAVVSMLLLFAAFVVYHCVRVVRDWRQRAHVAAERWPEDRAFARPSQPAWCSSEWPGVGRCDRLDGHVGSHHCLVQFEWAEDHQPGPFRFEWNASVVSVCPAPFAAPVVPERDIRLH